MAQTDHSQAEKDSDHGDGSPRGLQTAEDTLCLQGTKGKNPPTHLAA